MNFNPEHYARVLAAKEQKKRLGIPDVYKVGISATTVHQLPEINFPLNKFHNAKTR